MTTWDRALRSSVYSTRSGNRKGYATAEEFKDFCNTTVPLARLRQRVFTTADPFNVDVEIAHFGAKPLENVKGVWRIVGGGFQTQGEWDATTIPIGKNIPLGKD